MGWKNPLFVFSKDYLKQNYIIENLPEGCGKGKVK
jgi:hypothetical protein